MKENQLRPSVQRRKQKKVKIRELANEVSSLTGYRQVDVREVIKATIDEIVKHLDSHNSVELPKLGTLYPVIQTPRMANKMTPGTRIAERIKVPAKWVLRFRPGMFIKGKLLEKKPTQREVDELYIK